MALKLTYEEREALLGRLEAKKHLAKDPNETDRIIRNLRQLQKRELMKMQKQNEK